MREVVETNVSVYVIRSSNFSCNVLYRCGKVARSQTAGKNKKQDRERERGEGTILPPP